MNCVDMGVFTAVRVPSPLSLQSITYHLQMIPATPIQFSIRAEGHSPTQMLHIKQRIYNRMGRNEEVRILRDRS